MKERKKEKQKLNYRREKGKKQIRLGEKKIVGAVSGSYTLSSSSSISYSCVFYSFDSYFSFFYFFLFFLDILFFFWLVINTTCYFTSVVKGNGGGKVGYPATNSCG